MRSRKTACWLIGALAVIGCRGVMAEDTLKLAIGQRGNWENAATGSPDSTKRWSMR